MLRHLRKEAQPLAIDREVACFLAAGRKPVAIKIERGGLQIVGVADDAQHRAASAGDLAGFDLFAVRFDRPVGPDTEVRAVLGRRRRTPLGPPDIEGRTCAGVQARCLAPRDEPPDGGTERRRVAPMLHDRHLRGRHVPYRHVVTCKSLHELVPRIVERPEGRKPRLPVGRVAERRRRLPEPLPKGASEGVRCVVTGIHRDVRHALGVCVGQQVGSTLHTGQLDIAMHGQPEGRRELPMEMKPRERRNTAHRFQVQIIVEMPVNVFQHSPHPGLIVLQRRLHRPSSVAAPFSRGRP